MGILRQEQVTLLTDYDTNSAYYQAFSSLYTTICFDWENTKDRQRAIALTAPTSFTGETTAAANLAIIAAQTGTPTILVDADLHTPTLQQRFGINQQPGLSDLLTGATAQPSTALRAYLSDTFIHDLHLLGAGTGTNKGKFFGPLLASQLRTLVTQLRHYLAETETRPGLIIFHTPPVLAQNDAALISTCVDQTFLVIATGQTTRTQARRAQEQLERAHTHLAGIIMLNN